MDITVAPAWITAISTLCLLLWTLCKDMFGGRQNEVSSKQELLDQHAQTDIIAPTEELLDQRKQYDTESIQELDQRKKKQVASIRESENEYAMLQSNIQLLKLEKRELLKEVTEARTKLVLKKGL